MTTTVSQVLGTCEDDAVEPAEDKLGLRCPRCQSTNGFDIDAVATVRYKDGKLELQDCELTVYPSSTTVHCLDCGSNGDMRQFLID